MCVKNVKELAPLLNSVSGEVRVVREYLPNGALRCHQTSASGDLIEVVVEFRSDNNFHDTYWLLEEPAGHLLEGWTLVRDNDGLLGLEYAG